MESEKPRGEDGPGLAGVLLWQGHSADGMTDGDRVTIRPEPVFNPGLLSLSNWTAHTPVLDISAAKSSRRPPSRIAATRRFSARLRRFTSAA